MTARPVRIGVVGLGVGEQHLRSYRDIEGCEVVAVCDIDPERVQAVAREHDIAERHTDWRKVTGHPDIDAVSICSYDDGHAEQAIDAFRTGKHAFVEKPVALRRSEAEALLRAQQDSGRIISSNLILRESPRFIEVRRMVRDGEFGDVFYMEGDYIHDILWKITEGWRGAMDYYCVTYGGGIHLIDLMRWILGEEVAEVTGMGTNIRSRGTQYRYDDTIVTLMRFANGTLAKSLTTYGPRRTKFHALDIYGTKRTFVNDMPDAKLFEGDRPEDESAMTVPYPAMRKGDLLPDFVAAIRERREPNVNAVDVFRVMDVCFAADEAAQTGRSVKVGYLL